MKIISNFKDYYDVVQGIDRDYTPVYMRQTVEYGMGEREQTRQQIHPGQLPAVGYSQGPGAVAFCGRLYPFWRVDGEYCYTLKQVVAAIEGKLARIEDGVGYGPVVKDLKRVLDALHSGKSERQDWGRKIQWGRLNTASWKQWQEHMVTAGKISNDVFLREKAPVIAVIGENTIINPNLYLLRFNTVMDPYTAYQELSMFLGNNLAQQVDPIPKMTDELKAHAHGFDRWSFRTHKEDSRKAKKKREKEAAKAKASPDETEILLDDRDFN